MENKPKLTSYSDYGFRDAAPSHMHRHLLRPILELGGGLNSNTRVLDVGCGNGYMVGEFLKHGCQMVGLDLSESGVAIARRTHPGARFEVLAAEANILERLGEKPFDIVVSTEVVEHVYAPREYARGCFSALKPGGRFICTTPYHGYLKNLVLALANHWDAHANPLWDGGHIKLWSRRTLTSLLVETGFKNIQFRGAGRVPYLWMSMIMAGDKPTL